MALDNVIASDTKADLYGMPSYLPSTFPVLFLMGETAVGDTPVRAYEWNPSSSTADDGENTIQPTAITGSGRYIKMTNQVNADWSAGSGLSMIKNKPTLATVASSGSYNDLTSKPSIPGAQQAYDGTTLRSIAFPVFLSATVASGVAVFNLTADGTSTGTALFPNGVIQSSLNLYVNDATAAYQMAFAFSNSNKTVTVTANKLTTASLLTGILGQGQANGAVVKLQVWGY